MRIQKAVEQALFAYGKLGLLIEDAPDAVLRTAREIYGADGLPLWWLRYQDVESAEEALRAACDAVLAGNPAWAKGLPVIVVIDRYLKSKQSARVLPWDGEEATVGKNIGPMLKQLKQGGGCVAAVTSYLEPLKGTTDVPWKPRHHEPLFRLRSEMHGDLLSFGPSRNARVADLRAGVDAWRCRSWDSVLRGLASAFHRSARDQDFVQILFTGAGASLANHPLAPGIPPTWFLLDWLCWDLEGRRWNEPVWPLPVVEGDRKPKIPVRALAELTSNISRKGSAADLEWTLEELFRARPRDNPKEEVERYASAFRRALQRYDHAFPYHSWLLAQLPWTAIVTTNFDGFHERAAASAASSVPREQAERVRRLGDIGDLPLKLSKKSRAAKILRSPGLFKPYGSLTKMGPLALTHRDFWEQIDRVESVLREIPKGTRECWLVFLGHRLNSALLTDVVNRRLNKSKTPTQVVWVDPACYEIDAHPNKGAFLLQSFQATFDEARPQDDLHEYQPLPARALDFAYDLWFRYSRLGGN